MEATTAPSPDAGRRREVLELLAGVRDILDGRVLRPVPPPWAEARGWTPFLLGLSDGDLELCERRGLPAALPGLAGAPASLLDLAARVAAATALPGSAAGPVAALRRPRHVSPRKDAQIRRLLEALEGFRGRVDRIVEIGAGRGHLVRRAGDAWGVEALGVEIQERLVERARALAEEDGVDGKARFVRADASGGLPDLRPGDLALGLHACGALADAIVLGAAAARCPIALVACCHQKHPALRRESLSAEGRRLGLAFPSNVLGLANLHPRPAGIGDRLDLAREERAGRYALCLLLEGRGLPADEERNLRPPRGHRTYRGFPAMAEAACRERGIAPPAETEIRECLERARSDRAVIRRLALPRNLLARLLEVGLAADRAEFLAEREFTARLGAVFPDRDSPRNVLLLAEPARPATP